MQYVLKIHCSDQKGLVHQVSGIMFDQGLNMIENEEFVEKDFDHFFMRSEFEGELNNDDVLNQFKTILPANAEIDLQEKHKKDIVILATKEYHCLGDLLVRHHFGELRANIKAVVSNHNTLSEFQGMKAIIEGHKKLSKGRGVFANTNHEWLCLWGIGIANLARTYGLNVDPIPPLIPADLLLNS